MPRPYKATRPPALKTTPAFGHPSSKSGGEIFPESFFSLFFRKKKKIHQLLPEQPYQLAVGNFVAYNFSCLMPHSS